MVATATSNGRVTYVTEGDLALVDRARAPASTNPPWRKQPGAGGST